MVVAAVAVRLLLPLLRCSAAAVPRLLLLDAPRGGFCFARERRASQAVRVIAVEINAGL